MRLLSYYEEETPRAAALVAGQVIDLARLGETQGVELSASVIDYVRDETLLEAARSALATVNPDLPGGVGSPVESVRLAAPHRPGKIVGVGLNYTEHVAESSRSLDTDKELPTRPVLFSKPGTAVVGPEEPIQHNAALTKELDWECELAVVIGKTAKGVSQEEALDYVMGYTITNDISARDQRRSGQWFFSKGQDTYAPLGPWIVTADELGDPQKLDVKLAVNGEVKQDSNTRFMLFPVTELIADISSGMTLEPGDVIATGSPSGVGAAQEPPQYLQGGDTVELSIERIGVLRNPVVAV